MGLKGENGDQTVKVFSWPLLPHPFLDDNKWPVVVHAKTCVGPREIVVRRYWLSGGEPK